MSENRHELETSRGGRPPLSVASLKGRHFFLTVPHFSCTLDQVIDALKVHQSQWQYMRYAVVLQTHTKDEDKDKHLHLYVSYPKQCRLRLDRFDYLGKHGKLERVRDYTAILIYMSKEARPRANFDYIEDIMRKDFVRAVELLLSQGHNIRQIYRTYSSVVASKNWAGYLRFLSYQEDSQKFLDEAAKPGIRFITPELVQSRLNDEEYQQYHSNPIFKRIVDLINDTVRYGSHRPHKAKALFLTGAPNTGKTTLGRALQRNMGTFTFPDDGWWQGYQSDVFRLIIWNEFNLKRLQYPTLLKFLQGLRMDMPVKGSHITRSDNPLIFLTSNLTLEELIRTRFRSPQYRALARTNLAARIEEIDIGNTPVFLILKLLVPPPGEV